MMNLRPVIHFTGQCGYDQPPPFHPAEVYPELGALAAETAPDNAIYAGVRTLLHHLGYDAKNYGTAAWNPLSDRVARE